MIMAWHKIKFAFFVKKSMAIGKKEREGFNVFMLLGKNNEFWGCAMAVKDKAE